MISRQNLNLQASLIEHDCMIMAESNDEFVMQCHSKQDRSPTFGVTVIDGTSYQEDNLILISKNSNYSISANSTLMQKTSIVTNGKSTSHFIDRYYDFTYHRIVDS